VFFFGGNEAPPAFNKQEWDFYWALFVIAFSLYFYQPQRFVAMCQASVLVFLRFLESVCIRSISRGVFPGLLIVFERSIYPTFLNEPQRNEATIEERVSFWYE